MVGDVHKFTCDHCGMIHLGPPNDGRCVTCGCQKLTDHGIPSEEETFQSPRICMECQKVMAKIKAIVTLGGVAYRCVSCRATGAFMPDHPQAQKLKGMFPDRSQFDLDAIDCPECQKKRNEP